MTQPWDLPTKPSNWETKFVLRSGTIPVVLGGRQPPFHQQELLQENLPQFETALTPQQATQNAEPAAPGDTAFQHKMIPVRVEGVPPSSDEREQLQEILNQLERALTPQQAMQNAEPAAQGDTAFQHKAIPVVLGGRPPSFDEQEQLREILNQLERALTPQHAVAQAQQADLRDTAFQHKVIPVRVEGVPPSVELRPRANLSVQPAEHDLTEGSREAVPALRSPFTEASPLGLSGTVGSLTFVLLLGVGVTWLLSSGSPSQLGESDQVGASTPGDPLEGQGDEPIPGIAIKDASSPPLTMVAHWLPASLTTPELNEEISIAIGSSPPVVHETLVPALVVTSSPDQPFMPHLAIEVASNPASTSAVNWLPSPLRMPDADEGMPQSVNPLPPVVHVQPAPTLVVISSHDQPLPDRAIESASNPALSSAANWQPSPLRLPESDEGPPSALDTLSLAVQANSAQALAVISLPERPPPRGVAIEPTSNPALTDAVHWSPSLLAMPELNESMSFAVGRLLPITHANSAPTLAIISPPDLPPSQMDHLQSPEGPLQVSNMAQTSATSLDGLYYQVALHLPPDLAQVTIDETQSALQAAGLEVISTSVPRFGVARSEVRFFHVEDASEAARLAELMNAGVRDYSAYRPVPPPGTLEVWLAPEADE